jgi:hypothetical protein
MTESMPYIAQEFEITRMRWRPIEEWGMVVSPETQIVDLYGKKWDARKDSYDKRRFPNCQWSKTASSQRTPYGNPQNWMNFNDDYHATHFMILEMPWTP